ncbi:MAG TPA: hypothetical protein VFV83_08290 [Chthoniobacteraceae bacterium]|nr:hypothetical protein [Chthoniobacteraceae bacterium]
MTVCSTTTGFAGSASGSGVVGSGASGGLIVLAGAGRVEGAGEVEAITGGGAGSGGIGAGGVAGAGSGVAVEGGAAGSLELAIDPGGAVSFEERVVKKTMSPISTNAPTPAPISIGIFVCSGLFTLTSWRGCPHSGQMKFPGTEIGWLRYAVVHFV